MLYVEPKQRKDGYSFGVYIQKLQRYMEFVSREEYIEFMNELNGIEDEDY